MLQSLIDKLVKELELPESALTPTSGGYYLPFEDDIAVTITEQGTSIYFSSNVTSIPEKNEEELFTHALLGNLFGQGTKGAILGLDTEGKTLTLGLYIDYSIDYREFRDKLEDFLNTIEFWRDEIHNFETKT